MSDTDRKLSALAELVNHCLTSLGSDDFAGQLIAGLRQFVSIEDATVLYYARDDPAHGRLSRKS